MKNVSTIEIGSFGLNLKQVRMLKSIKYMLTFCLSLLKSDIGTQFRLNREVLILFDIVLYLVIRTPIRHPNFIFLVVLYLVG